MLVMLNGLTCSPKKMEGNTRVLCTERVIPMADGYEWY